MKTRPISPQPIVIHIHNVPPRWLDAPKAASYLSCSPRMIEELWRNGEVPYVLVGGKQVVEKVDLDAWCDKQAKKTGKLREPTATRDGTVGPGERKLELSLRLFHVFPFSKAASVATLPSALL